MSTDPPPPPDLAEWLSTPGTPVAGYIRGLLGQIERLAALLAPVEGVDVEEVLRLADAPARTPTAAEDRDATLAYAAPVLAREVVRLRAQTERLKTRLDVMETERNEARDRLADARADHLDAVDSARRTQAERDELRLTLAAEQGRPEGAPSEGWRAASGDWSRGRARVKRSGFLWRWHVYAPAPNDNKATIASGLLPTARAAMIAADKAAP